MQHYGDITKIKGAEVPIVDVVTGGSPCQDLSVAGKREGMSKKCTNEDCGYIMVGNVDDEKCPKCGAPMEFTRSGLFMEQIRIIKEMRDEDKRLRPIRGADEYIRPRYMVWENVPGAFSSNKGEDFRAVLEETAKVVQGDACIPGPPGGKWPYAGCIMGDGWSIAWRVHDAQFWGVPQRRKRIALVADFGGDTAAEILFERKSLPGDSESCGTQGQEVAGAAKGCLREAGSAYTLKIRGGREIDSHGHKAGKGALIQTEKSGTLGVSQDQTLIQVSSDGEIAGTLDASYYKGCGLRQGRERTVVCSNYKADGADGKGVAFATVGDHENRPTDMTNLVIEPCNWDGSQVAPTLTSNNAGGGQRMPDKDNFNAVISYGLDRASFNQGINAQYDFQVDEEKVDTQAVQDPGEVCQSVVRHLTPLECERLQGFPDHWTDIGDWVDSKGKKHKGESDSPRYKALGNSIALPFWKWMAKRMRNYLGDKPTMASLFDGIGGFPLSYLEAGVKPIWASEIEEFPIAVTKIRFPDIEDDV